MVAAAVASSHVQTSNLKCSTRQSLGCGRRPLYEEINVARLFSHGSRRQEVFTDWPMPDRIPRLQRNLTEENGCYRS